MSAHTTGPAVTARAALRNTPVGCLYRNTRRVLRAVGDRVSFDAWRAWSRVRHGDRRWINVYGDRQLVVLTSDYRGYLVAKRHGSQRQKIEIWRELAELKPELCIDVGANYGEFSVAISDLEIPTIAIEPHPRVAECLQETVRPFPWITVVRGAAGAFEGETTFYMHAQSSGSSSLTGTWSPRIFAGMGQARLTPIETPIFSVSSLVKEQCGRFPRTVLIKVDVEGHELDVYRGAQNLLSETEAWRLILEHSQTILGGEEQATQAWHAWRQHPGIVVVGEKGIYQEKSNENPYQSLDSFIMSSRLPAEAPADTCDVIIGGGKMGFIQGP